MKTFTHVILPIAIIIGMVFGITWMVNYTPPDAKNKDKPNVSTTRSLVFPLTTIQSDPNDWKLRYWNSHYEVGRKGEFWYWFCNINEQPVRFVSTGVSCKCAGVEAAVIPQPAMAQYLTNQATSHLPGMPAGPILDLASLLELNKHLQWQSLSDKADISIPGAPSAPGEGAGAPRMNNNPQFGILKLKWEAKAPDANKDGKDSVTAHFTTQLPNTSPAAMNLEANFVVVKPFNLHIPSTGKLNELALGTIEPGSVHTHEVICWSKTRSELPLSLELVTAGNYKDCVSWSEPKRLTNEEVAALEKSLHASDQPPLRIKSAYRVNVTVYEQREIDSNGKKALRQLDIGPLTFLTNITAGAFDGVPATKPEALYTHGLVRGDVRIFRGGEATDAVDFGSSFDGDQDETRKVRIVSQRERAGLQLELVREETLPEYLVVNLHKPEEKGETHEWVLEVTIPAKTLFGDLASSSKIILVTNDPIPRRIRIPVRAKQQK